MNNCFENASESYEHLNICLKKFCEFPLSVNFINILCTCFLYESAFMPKRN